MRVLRPFVLVLALSAAPAAAADPLCDAINQAAQAGVRNNQFSAFHGKVPAPEGFTCRIATDDDLGAYACTMAVEAKTHIAKASALIASVRACVSGSTIVEESPKQANAVFMISRQPKTWVVVNGADDPERLRFNVVVQHRESISSHQVLTGYEIDPAEIARPYDPWVETHP